MALKPIKHITDTGTQLLTSSQAECALEKIKLLIQRYEFNCEQPVLTLERIELLIAYYAEIGILHGQYEATKDELEGMRRAVKTFEDTQAQRIERMGQLNASIENFVID